MFTKKLIENSEKVQRNRHAVPKLQSISVFSDIAKFADFRWKYVDISTIQGVCHVTHIYF